MACSQAYAGDAEAAAVIRGLCRREKIPCQSFLNRSDLRGGSTLGAMLSANMPIRTMDIGVPILAMHSARETMGAEDQQALQRLVRAFSAAERMNGETGWFGVYCNAFRFLYYPFVLKHGIIIDNVCR